MNDIQLIRALSHVDQDLIAASCEDFPRRRSQKHLWRYVSAAAACLVCLGAVLLIVRHGSIPDDIVTPQPDPDTTTEPDTTPEPPPIDPSTIHAPSDAQDCPPYITHNGDIYIVSPLGATTWDEVLPDGYAPAGTVNVQYTLDGSECSEESYPYYTHPDSPYRIYVYHKVALSQPANTAKWEERYVPYVHESVRSSWFLSCDDVLYIRFHDAYGSFFTEHHAISEDVMQRLQESYEKSFAEIPAGFSLIGTAQTVDYNTLPGGALCSNHTGGEVYANPDEPDVLLQAERFNYSGGSKIVYTAYVRYGIGLDEGELLPWFRTLPQ